MCTTECSSRCHARHEGRAMWVACNRARFPATRPCVFCELKIMKIVILIYEIIQEKFITDYQIYLPDGQHTIKIASSLGMQNLHNTYL